MRVIDKSKLSKGICNYINQHFDYFYCELNTEDFSAIHIISVYKLKSFRWKRFGVIKITPPKHKIKIYIKEGYIKKYSFDNFKEIIKNMEKDLKLDATLEIVSSFSGF